MREADGTERVLIDPTELDPAGTTTLDAGMPTIEGDRLAYQLSTGGDEESRLDVLDVATGERLDGPIDRCRYSPVGWLPGGRSSTTCAGWRRMRCPAGEEQFHRRVWRHRVGADPATDVVVYGDGRDPTDYYGVRVSRDGRWLLVTAPAGTAPAQRRLDRRPHRADGRRCAGARRAWTPRVPVDRPRRPALRAHRPGRPARPAGRRRPGRPRARALGRSCAPRTPTGCSRTCAVLADGADDVGRCCAVLTRHAAPRSRVHDLADRRPARRRCRCPAGQRWLGIDRAPEGGREAVVRLHRPRHAADGVALDRDDPARPRRGRARRAPVDSAGRARQPGARTRSADGTDGAHVRASPPVAAPRPARARPCSTATAASTSRSPRRTRRRAGLGRGRRRLGGREPARRLRERRGLAPRRHAGSTSRTSSTTSRPRPSG